MVRTAHSLAYNEIHDEIVIPQPFSQAILTFRGGANGEEAPIRVIQGPLTQLYNYVDQIVLDQVNGEIYVMAGYPFPDHIEVFNREANGNVAPIRVLKGPDNTVLGFTPSKAPAGLAGGLAVDPVNNVLLLAGAEGVVIFDRTAQGNAQPRGMIRSPKARMGGKLFAYPPRSEIILIGDDALVDPGTAARERSFQSFLLHGTERGAGGGSGYDADPMEKKGNGTFVRVWNIDDRGNVPPRREWRIMGPQKSLWGPEETGAEGDWSSISAGTLDPKNKSLILKSKPLNAIFTYYFPELFE